MTEKISIIVPTRNRWDLLWQRCIPSILKQTYTNYEIIIVDDGSSDRCFFTDPSKPLKVYRIEKTYPYPTDDKKAEWLAGPCLALNEGLKYVTGDWIYRCDDDDILLPDCLESLLKFAKEGEYDFVSALWKDKNDLIGMPYEWSDIDGKYFYVGGVQTWLCNSKYKNIKYNPNCWKKSWNANNELDWFQQVISIYKPTIGFLPKVVCSILPRPGNISIGSHAYVKENRWDLAENHLPESSLQEAVQNQSS